MRSGYTSLAVVVVLPALASGCRGTAVPRIGEASNPGPSGPGTLGADKGAKCSGLGPGPV